MAHRSAFTRPDRSGRTGPDTAHHVIPARSARCRAWAARNLARLGNQARLGLVVKHMALIDELEPILRQITPEAHKRWEHSISDVPLEYRQRHAAEWQKIADEFFG